MRHLARAGFDPLYGARPLKRAIERYLVYPLANLVSTGQVRYGDHIAVECGRSQAKLEFEKSSPKLKVVGEGMPVP